VLASTTRFIFTKRSTLNVIPSAIAMSAVVPLVMAVLLICLSKRGGMIWAFAATFVVGGFGSFLLAMALNRLVAPVEEYFAGDPGSIRAGLASSFLSAALSEELARLLTCIGTMAVLRRWIGREVIVTCGTIGLGFAMFENMLYSLTANTGVEILIGRTVPTISHGAAALIMGSFLPQADSGGGMIRVWPFVCALTVPLVLHGLYDFGSFLLEVTEFPVLPDSPSAADYKLLIAPMAIMFFVTALGLVELGWSGFIVYQLRRTSPEGR
jgi:RsiW-degrading membrane proteinase PrsW (M82 family)